MSYPTPAMTMAAMHRPQAFPPSPPHSLPRPSNGTGPMALHGGPDHGKHPLQIVDEHLQEHYRVLSRFLASTAAQDEQGDVEPHHRARDKLLRLSTVQFQELSTDVYDELLRREHERRHPPPPSDTNYPKFLLPRPNYHPKRNQARQKLATLATNKFRELVGDVLYELDRRYPRFAQTRPPIPPGPYPPGQPGGSRIPSNPRGVRPPSNPTIRSQPSIPVLRSQASNPALRPHPSNPNLRAQPNNPALRTQQSTPSLRTRARADSRTGPRNAPPPLPAYVQGLRRPSVTGSPNPSSSPPTSPTGPYTPAADNQYQSVNAHLRPNEYGRPLPRDFQTPPSAGNKVSRPENIDEINDGNASESDYGPDRTSRRITNKSLPFSMEPDIGSDSQTQTSRLERRIGELEEQLRRRNMELSQSQTFEAEHKQALAAERTKSSTRSGELEARIRSVETQNTSLQNEVNALKASNSGLQNTQQDHNNCEWRARFNNLKQEYDEQQNLVDHVRQQAAQNLHEMRALAEETAQATDRDDKLAQHIAELEANVVDWKNRYTKAKAQLRNLRAVSTPFLLGSANAGMLAKDGSLTDPNGLVKDVSITQYQMAVDELLQLTHSSNPSSVLDYMRTIVASVRAVTEDVDSAASSNGSSIRDSNSNSISSNGTATTSATAPSTVDSDANKRHSKLRARISAAANNLITAARNYSAAGGISPASLVDAAAGNLTAAVVELVKEVKVRPTPRAELDLDFDSEPGLDMLNGRENGFLGIGGYGR